MKTVAFVVNGGPDSPMGERAGSLAERLDGRFRVRTAYRAGGRGGAAARFLAWLTRTRPDLAYVFDLAGPGDAAAAAYRALTGTPFVLETGDAVHALVRSAGTRGPLGRFLTRVLEESALRAADRVVVRGTGHQRHLRRKGLAAAVLRDGVDPRKFRPLDAAGLRRRLGLEGVLTLGLVGSCRWSERLGTCYGWDLVEAVRLLRDSPVRGLLVGDGDGVERLRQRCRDYGIEGRVLFVGRVPYDDLPEYLNVMDVCLSTQTNNLAGRVRTTGKLPLYLAAGRYVLASRVGEAELLLPPEMLVDYAGEVDPEYPARLAERVRPLLADPGRLAAGLGNVATAARLLDYDVLADRLAGLLDDVLRAPRRPVRIPGAAWAAGAGR